jgi:PKHD-type hydroxylase
MDYVIYDDLFTPNELESIKKQCTVFPTETGKIGDSSSTNIDEKVRKSDVHFIHHNDYTHWIYNKIFYVMSKVNYETWNLNLSVCENIQYSEYKKNGHYDWHIDKGNVHAYPEITRKLSFAMFLNDVEEYEGGNFEVQGTIENKVEKKTGRCIIFPSYVRHRVAPVTSGIRKSLVLWVSGPNFM